MSDLYTFTHPEGTERLTSSRNQVVDSRGNVYRPAPISRGQVRQMGVDTGDSTVTIQLEADDDFAIFLKDTMYRPSITIHDQTEYLEFTGAIDGTLQESDAQAFPVLTLQALPPYRTKLAGTHQRILYSMRCQWEYGERSTCRFDKSRLSYRTTVTGITRNGTRIEVASDGGARSGTYTGGIIQILTGARPERHIERHLGNTMTIRTRFRSALAVGDPVYLEEGCRHDYSHCRSKGNTVNFMGFLHVPSRTPDKIQRSRDYDAG